MHARSLLESLAPKFHVGADILDFLFGITQRISLSLRHCQCVSCLRGRAVLDDGGSIKLDDGFSLTVPFERFLLHNKESHVCKWGL